MSKIKSISALEIHDSRGNPAVMVTVARNNGITAGADMLKPPAIAVIGALCISVILSLIAAPAVYSLFLSRNPGRTHAREAV